MVAPAGCAEAQCESGTGRCVLLARDQDGDGQRASACLGMVAVQTGPDCDDRPNGGAEINTNALEVCEVADVDENCNGMANEGCSCLTIGVSQPCCSGRGLQTCQAVDGGSALSMCSAPASVERCNGLDDDCNGLVDDAIQLDPDAGTFAVDGGFGNSDAGCAVGTGACRRAGAVSCSQAALVCSAAAGIPGAEVCNLVDDDCDGQVDEPGAGLCPVGGQSCSALGACVCPPGETACEGSCRVLGGSCSVGVGACLRVGTVVCSAATAGTACSALPGPATPEVCDFVDNNCNGQVDENTTIVCYPDTDGDQYASSSTATTHCPVASRAQFGNCPNGYVSPAASLGIDCSPNNPSLFKQRSTRANADGDPYCAGATVTACMGSSPGVGRQFAELCPANNDCDDSNAALFQNLIVRADSDSDGYCTGPYYSQCTGAAAQPGTKVNCGAVDCNDNNSYATSSCYISNGYSTQTVTKNCGVGPPPCESKYAGPQAGGCGPGFSPVNLSTIASSQSTCSAVSATYANTCCGGVIFGSVTCSIRGDCAADPTD